MEVFETAADGCSYHVPDKIGEPVDDRLHSTDELQVLCFADALLDQEHDKAGRDEGHRKDDTDRHKDVHWCGHPEKDSAAEGTIRAYTHTHTWISEAYPREKDLFTTYILFRVKDD